MIDILDRIKARHSVVSDGTVVVRSAQIRMGESDRLVTATIHTDHVALDGSVLLTSGISTEYFPGSVRAVYIDHARSSLDAVGVCESFEIGPSSIRTVTRIRRTDLGDRLIDAITDGVVGHTSIAVLVDQVSAPSSDDLRKWPGCSQVMTRSRCLEYSFTSFPMNRWASISAHVQSDEGIISVRDDIVV